MNKTPAIGFITYDWTWGYEPIKPNGCAWYRCWLPAIQLKKHGWESGMGVPTFHPDHGLGILIPDKKAIHGWDIIVIKLIMLKDYVEHVAKAREMGQKIVVDIDDHMEGLAETNLAYKTTDPRSNPNNNREHYIKIIEQADAITVSTPFLYGWYKNKYPNKPIYMVRNGIDPERWNFHKDYRRFLPMFGWVGATPWRSGDLEILNPFFGEFLKKKNLKFHHGGSVKGAPTAYDQIGIDKRLFTSEPMKTVVEVPELYRKMDVGIVPLKDIPFNHAKSYLKGLEYAASGIPFIASDLPEYHLLADAGVGRVASNKDEWLSHMDAFLDPAVREKERLQSLEIIKSEFSMDNRGVEWDQVFREILEL